MKIKWKNVIVILRSYLELIPFPLWEEMRELLEIMLNSKQKKTMDLKQIHDYTAMEGLKHVRNCRLFWNP